MLREERALRWAIVASVGSALVKLVTGLATGSMAMASSAADSIGDVIISVANLFVVRFSEAAPDEEHNYGHGKIEGLGAMFEGGFIGAAGLFILYGGVDKLLHPQPAAQGWLGIIVMVPVLFTTLAVVRYMRKVARETGSLVLRADALHYESDVWMNTGVLLSLVLTRLTGRGEIDAVVSLGIAVWMVRASLSVVREGFDVVMDRSLPAPMVEQVRAAIVAGPGVVAYHDLRTRGGKDPLVDVHVEVAPTMTALELHDLHLQILSSVQAIAGASARVLLHADPLGHADGDHEGPIAE
jgi:ferrous-iron efflux pump FieF